MQAQMARAEGKKKRVLHSLVYYEHFLIFSHHWLFKSNW